MSTTVSSSLELGGMATPTNADIGVSSEQLRFSHCLEQASAENVYRSDLGLRELLEQRQ